MNKYTFNMESQIPKTDIRNDMEVLFQQKNEFSNQLQNSKNVIDQLNIKRMDLANSIREKIMKNKQKMLKRNAELQQLISSHFLKAKSFYRDNEFESVILECETILKINPNNMDAKSLLEDAEQKIFFNKEKERLEKERLKNKQKEYELMLFNVNKHLTNSNYLDALELLEEKVLNMGVNQEVQNLIDLCKRKIEEKKLKQLKDQEVELKKHQQIQNLFAAAIRFFNEGIYDQANSFFNQILKLDSSHADSLEYLIKIEKEMKFIEKEAQRKLKEKKKNIKVIEVEARKLARNNEFEIAYSKLEQAIIDFQEDSLKNVLEEVHLMEEAKKIKEEQQKQSTRLKIHREIKDTKLKEEKYLEGLFQYEKFLNEKKYKAAFLYLQSMIKEFFDKDDLKYKLEEVVAYIKEEEKIESQKKLEELEIKRECNNSIGQARALYYEGKIEESKTICLDLVKRNQFSVKEAQEIIILCEKKIKIIKEHNEVGEQKQKELKQQKEIEAFNALEVQFRKSLLENNFHSALILLEDLRLKSLNYPGLKEKYSILSETYNKVHSKYKEEKQQRDISYHQFLNLAIEQYQNDDFYSAYGNFKQALEIYSDDPDIIEFKNKSFNKMSLIEQKNKEQEIHIEEFRKAYQLLKMKLLKLEKEEDYSGAIDECAKLAVRFPGSSKIQQEIDLLSTKMDSYLINQQAKKMNIHEEQKHNKQKIVREMIVKGEINLKQNNFEEAYKYFFEVMKTDPDNQVVYDLLEDTEKSKKLFEKKSLEEREAEKLNKFKIEKLIFNAEKYVRTGDYQKAIEFYEKAFEENQKNVELKGIIIELENRMNSLMQEKQEIKEKNEMQINEWTIAATKCFLEKKYHEAVSLCEKILLLVPENPKISDLKNEILEAKKQRDMHEAEKARHEDEQKRLDKEKTEINEQNRIAEIRSIHQAGLEFYRNDEFERAIEEWEKIKFIDSANPVVSEEIRRAKLKIKEIEITKLQEKELNKQNETKSNHLWLEGRYFFREGEYNKAIDAWEKAILISGRERRFIDSIEKAHTLLQKKKNENERSTLILEKQRKNLSNLVFLGNRYYNNSQYSEAIQFWEKALALDPENIEIKNGILNAEDKIRMQLGKNEKLAINKLDIEGVANEDVVDTDYFSGDVEKNNILPNEGLNIIEDKLL